MEQTERGRGETERESEEGRDVEKGRKIGLGEETQREQGITREDFPNNPLD